MQNVVVQLENGEFLEFAGELVSSASREVVHDGRRSTVFEYGLYRREEGGYLLALRSYEKIGARSFHLRFTSLSDARDYLARDKGSEALLVELFAGIGE